MEIITIIILIFFGITLYGHRKSLENLISRIEDIEEKLGTQRETYQEAINRIFEGPTEEELHKPEYLINKNKSKDYGEVTINALKRATLDENNID